MGNFAVVVVKPEGYIHAEAFRPVQQALVQALRELGHDAIAVNGYVCDVSPPNRRRRHIVLGVNLIGRYGVLPPPGSILYNLEQFSKESAWMSGCTSKLFNLRLPGIRDGSVVTDSQYELWDYSGDNRRCWSRSFGVNVKLVPIGYVKPAKPPRYLPEEERDIDVLFYGSVNERRAKVLDDLHARGLKVEALFGVYGDELERYIERAKVVLNMHYYDSQIFEIVRVSHLLASGRFVVSERSGKSDEAFEQGVMFADYNQLATVCADAVGRPELRECVAECGRNLFVTMPFSQYLRSVIAA